MLPAGRLIACAICGTQDIPSMAEWNYFDSFNRRVHPTCFMRMHKPDAFDKAQVLIDNDDATRLRPEPKNYDASKDGIASLGRGHKPHWWKGK